ncbi:MAG: cation transporter [Myxococcota bacterium]|nr:cation transporter [Myxococcota bacterium]
MLFLLLCLAPVFADSLPAGRAVVDIKSMTCRGCETKVTEALSPIETVAKVHTSFSEKAACLELTGETSIASIEAAIASIEYTAENARSVTLCPTALVSKSRTDAWRDTAGLDVEVISRGEAIDLATHRVPDKFTVFDFGAPWCGPCVVAAKRLKAYLSAHPDTAVRAVVLDAPDPEASFALPAAQQYLQWASGLPYFEVRRPDGKRIYKGTDVTKLLASIDKERGK